MATIHARKRKDGSVGYTAQIRIKRAGKVVVNEAQTFARRKAAEAWAKKREVELSKPGAIEKAGAFDPPLRDAIARYVDESEKAIGRTKAQVLRSIARMPIADKPCSEVTSADLVAMLKGIRAQPQTRLNYLSHLSSVFAIARPAWGIPLDHQQVKDAMTVTGRLGITSKSKQRSRRPSLDELNRIMEHFTESRARRPRMIPMADIVLFALFSTRRQEEITTLRWDDLDEKRSMVLVRSMKHPGQKVGNDVLCLVTPEAMAVIKRQPRRGERIFPASTDAVSANFTRACQFLGIDDLHFHDLRREGVSRLFEIGWTIPQVASVSAHQSWASMKIYTRLDATRGDRYAGWKWLPVVAGQPASA